MAKVNISGAVKGKAVWPKKLEPVAWNNAGDMVRMKLGLYHAKNKVADGEVEYKNISIEGPAGIIRTSTAGVPDIGIPEGVLYVGCVRDDKKDRVLDNKTKHKKMTTEVSPKKCKRCSHGSLRERGRQATRSFAVRTDCDII